MAAWVILPFRGLSWRLTPVSTGKVLQSEQLRSNQTMNHSLGASLECLAGLPAAAFTLIGLSRHHQGTVMFLE